MKKHGNRYSMGLQLTQREAETLEKVMAKIRKIRQKKGRWIGEKQKLFQVEKDIEDIIIDADRGYVIHGVGGPE